MAPSRSKKWKPGVSQAELEAEEESEQKLWASARFWSTQLKIQAQRVEEYLNGESVDPGYANKAFEAAAQLKSYLGEAIAVRMARFDRERRLKDKAKKARGR
jgi:hypothetical protein